ncbi:hypothetical protein ACQ4M3_25840 [Leptolyngbya sp. AN03gr2]|uniref:hypothetical protein n=1 Tax=unclassified Leptolyngbya TaxID=2650499 RepID=UPI003D315650
MLLLLGFSLGIVIHQIEVLTSASEKVRWFYDPGDLNAYYAPTAWVSGAGRLYREVFSEYPLLANVIFGSCRFVAEGIRSISGGWIETRKAFDGVWISTAWVLYSWLAYRIYKRCSKQAVWIWLAPAPLYFTIFRYDIFPAIATFMALLYIRDSKYMRGALCIGMAIALKGYALFLVPSYFVYVLQRRGMRDAVKIVGVCLAPWVFGNLIVLLYGGWEGLVAPYLFHSNRELNGESTYDAIVYFTRFYRLKRISDYPWIAQMLQVAFPLIAMALRPKTFQALIDAFLISLLGFMSFSVFYSPQFLLWILPIACFSNSRSILRLCLISSWATFLYFPVAYGVRFETLPLLDWTVPIGPWAFQGLVTAIAVIRLMLMSISVRRILMAA